MWSRRSSILTVVSSFSLQSHATSEQSAGSMSRIFEEHNRLLGVSDQRESGSVQIMACLDSARSERTVFDLSHSCTLRDVEVPCQSSRCRLNGLWGQRRRERLSVSATAEHMGLCLLLACSVATFLGDNRLGVFSQVLLTSTLGKMALTTQLVPVSSGSV